MRIKVADSSWEIYKSPHISPLFSCGTLGRLCNLLNLNFFTWTMEETNPTQRTVKSPRWDGCSLKKNQLLPLPPTSKHLLSAPHLLLEATSLSFHSIIAPQSRKAHGSFYSLTSPVSPLPLSAIPLHSLVFLFPQTCEVAPVPGVLWLQSPSHTIGNITSRVYMEDFSSFFIV